MKMSFSPLQLFSPVQLVFCFILFFLPWIELSCTLPAEVTKNAPPGDLDEFKKETGLDPAKGIGMFTQSGLQIATGGVSVASDFEKISDKAGKKGGAGAGMKFGPDKLKKDDGETAPLLFLFPLALVAGIVVGCVPVQHLVRRLLLVACCLAALGVVGLQAAIGFPLEKEVAKQKEQVKAFVAPGAKTGGGEPEIVRVRWKLPLYLTLLLLLGAVGTAFLDGSLLAKKPKRRFVADFEDEDEDEEERPRKKKRAKVEDEDERPAKKPMFEVVDDDEEEPPRKKPKRRSVEDDEDDEDDRPRKKRRRDDD